MCLAALSSGVSFPFASSMISFEYAHFIASSAQESICDASGCLKVAYAGTTKLRLLAEDRKLFASYRVVTRCRRRDAESTCDDRSHYGDDEQSYDFACVFFILHFSFAIIDFGRGMTGIRRSGRRTDHLTILS